MEQYKGKGKKIIIYLREFCMCTGDDEVVREISVVEGTLARKAAKHELATS